MSIYKCISRNNASIGSSGGLGNLSLILFQQSDFFPGFFIMKNIQPHHSLLCWAWCGSRREHGMRNRLHTPGGRQQIYTWLLLLTLPTFLELKNVIYSRDTPPKRQPEMQPGYFQCRTLCGMDGEEAEAPHLPRNVQHLRILLHKVQNTIRCHQPKPLRRGRKNKTSQSAFTL